MIFLFWGLAIAMLLLAVGFVLFPIGATTFLPVTAVTVAVASVPLMAFGLYLMLGSPGVISAEAMPAQDAANVAATTRSSAQGSAGIGTVASLVAGLEARLQSEPDDAGGWMLLAQSYDHLGRHADAINAYERARALGKADVAFESKLLGKVLSAANVESVPAPVLRGRVDLSPAAADRIGPDDTVFIFAKESIDDRMPVVALRRPAAEIPFSFSLTDKEMMVPGQSLGQFDSLVVIARISKSGNASDNSQGLEAWSDPVSPFSDANIELLVAGTNAASNADE